MAELAFERVSKVFEDGTEAVVDFSLAVEDGETLVLVGPSGCGKSTLLRMVAGLEEITAGKISIGGRVVNHLPPKERGIAMVFQSYALYPHMNVSENVGFSLRLRGVPKKERLEKIQAGVETLQISELLDRLPKRISGGQRQRVAMGRAIVREPTAFLLDEPLSNLDAKLRVEMRAELLKLKLQLATTTIYVTHDQVEAMTMGTRVAVLRKGILQQVDGPYQLYRKPVNQFVAGFVGSPAMNFFPAELQNDGDRVFAIVDNQRILLDRETLASHPDLAPSQSARVVVGLRPEAFRSDLQPESEGDQVVEGTVRFVERLGADNYLHLDAFTRQDHTPFLVRVSPYCVRQRGDAVKAPFDASKLHFFDPDTGRAI